MELKVEDRKSTCKVLRYPQNRQCFISLAFWILIFGFSDCFVQTIYAAGLDMSREQFKTGRYKECFESARQAVEDGAGAAEWRILMLRSLLALGRYDEAADYADIVLEYSAPSIRLLKLAHTVYLSDGRADRASEVLATIYRAAVARRGAQVDSADLVALGEALLLLGGEPRIVLDEFYNRAIRNDPNCREAYFAAGSLAMAKQDYELAANQYRKAIERFADDPDAHYGLARAFYNSDRSSMLKSLDAALHINPRHAPSLILLAEHQIDSENYGAAAQLIDRVIAVNPWHPEAWAYRAVLALLANEPNTVNDRRANALKFWHTNPQVDYLIGMKLSQNYRFAEGSAYQRLSLNFDPNYMPAQIQLAEDLLRLGDEKQGWDLAEGVCTKDPYNVTAFNLMNLRDHLSMFKILSAEGFIVRMDELEAAVYGDRVIKLLQQAKSQLCSKYGLELDGPVTVELFPNQQDFAVRTFGMPGVDGFLAVCFGRLITANSPRAGRATSWEATLWHEFCHVVTLNLTANKMPRWLSEGISVYEELQHNPAWGQRMDPQYRRMILAGELTPISKLSAAFLNPPSPMHLQFAYYESSLAVEFLAERFGFTSLKAILADLAKGEEINSSIAGHAAPLNQLDPQFEAFVRKRAEELARDVDWEQPAAGQQVDPADHQAVADWLNNHPNSFWALRLQANNLLTDRRWEQAKEPLNKLISLYPQYVGEGNAYQLLAVAYRNLDQTEQEHQVLSKLATISADAAGAYERLMEIAVEQKNWREILEYGDKYLAVYPMLSTVHWRLGRAHEELGQDSQAIESYRRLLLLDPADPADINYRLARLLRQRDPAAAKRYILESLADAPRFREAHRLLLNILGNAGESSAPAPKNQPKPPVVQEDVL
jgi:tetratricopeptide (TPR) repeat protein